MQVNFFMIEVLQSRPKITALDLFDIDLHIFPTVKHASIIQSRY